MKISSSFQVTELLSECNDNSKNAVMSDLLGLKLLFLMDLKQLTIGPT